MTNDLFDHYAREFNRAVAEPALRRQVASRAARVGVAVFACAGVVAAALALFGPRVEREVPADDLRPPSAISSSFSVLDQRGDGTGTISTPHGDFRVGLDDNTGAICFEVFNTTVSQGGGCFSKARARAGHGSLVVPDDPRRGLDKDTSFRAFGVVPDGVSYVVYHGERVPVRNNVWGAPSSRGPREVTIPGIGTRDISVLTAPKASALTGCFRTADVDADTSVEMGPEGPGSPVEICERYWREVGFGSDPVPESLVACQGKGDAPWVFPGREGTCEALGLDPL